MSYLLFLDESGHDLRKSPYEVLAGVCVEDRDLWNLICNVQDAETEFFGMRIAPGVLELKGRKLLKTKTFRLAGGESELSPGERRDLARSCLEKQGTATRKELAALGQAKLAFVDYVLELCGKHRAKAFASIVDREAQRPEGDFLRKDYSYLFERYYHFLEDKTHSNMGIVVLDELETAQAHLLVEQMGQYFRNTRKGKTRASLIIPEPFFVHSHLTTAIQLADIVAYIVAWGVRLAPMTRPAREELQPFAERVLDLRFSTIREDGGGEQHRTWSFVPLDDLRPKEERE